LSWIVLDVLTIGAEAGTERQITDPFALGEFVAQRVARSLADGFALPLADGRHDIQDQTPRRPASLPRFGDRNKSHHFALEAFQQLAQVLYASREPVELRNNDGFHVASVDHGEKLAYAGPIKGLGGFAALHNDVRKLDALNQRHRANLLRLGV